MAKQLQLDFWFSSGFNAKDCIIDMVKEYNSSQSDVKINAVFQGLYEEMEMKLRTAAVTKKLPDIAQEKFEYLDLYIEGELLSPIDDEINSMDREDIFNEMWAAVTRDGKIYGIPFCVNTYVFFYNEDLLAAHGITAALIPTTWKEAIDVGKKLSMDTDDDGRLDQYAMIFWQNGIESYLPFLWALDGYVFKGDDSRITLTSDETYQATKFLRDLAHEHEIMPHDWTSFEGGQAFLSGKLAMGPFISSGLVYFEDNLPWNLKIAAYPTYKGKRRLPLTGLALVNFSKNKKRRKASHKFMMWLVNKQNTIKLYKDVGYLPVRKSAVNSLDLRAFIAENPNFSFPIEALDHSQTLPNHPDYYKINQMIIEMMERIILTDADIMRELETTEKAINSALEP
jgi:sn-glycerol 3-phosphate transport system substrate-binding protein